MIHSRRTLLGALAALPAAAAAQSRRRQNWKPKLGILCQYSESNLDFAKQDGFTSIQLSPGRTLSPDFTDAQIDAVKSKIKASGLYLSSLMVAVNHTAPDAAQRAKINADFIKAMELTAKLGAPYIATMSGNMPGKKLDQQVSEIVKVYTEQYFPVCQKLGVKILWEPWPDGPNVATGPVGYEALFKAFDNSPYVGLLYDPSHLQWQFMDPIQCARDFVDKIWDVHLKDTEILWHVVRKSGIRPLNGARWWRFRIPGSGIVDWKAFFTVLEEAGYQGAMNIEHEDEFYYPPSEPNSPDFTESYKQGFRVAHQYLKQFVPA